MNDKQLGVTVKKLSQELVPREVDLWPAIERKLLAEKRFPSQTMPSGQILIKQARRFRLGFVSLLTLLVLVIFIGFTSPGQTFAQAVIRFFSQSATQLATGAM